MATKRTSAAELMATLATDEKHRAIVDEKESLRSTKEAELAEDEANLVSDCESVGIEIKSVWDLVNSSASYAPAIPVLVRHLGMNHLPRTVEGIVRALTTDEARSAFEALANLFIATRDGASEMKWLLGAAIAETASSETANRVIELIHNESNGRGRAFLPLALLRLPKSEAIAQLRKLPTSADIDENVTKAIRLASVGL